MKLKQTILIIGTVLCGAVALLTAPVSLADCGGAQTTIISCDQTGDGGKCPDGSIISSSDIKNGKLCPDGSKPDVVTNSGIWGILLVALNILTGGIGIVAVAGIVYGAILYASAGGSPDQVKKAKTVILNVIIGLVTYALMYSFLNFIIPGGIFS